MLGLLLYKGLEIVYICSIEMPRSLSEADQALFLGSHVLRESLYGLVHLVMGIGLIWYVVILLLSKQVKKS